MARTINVDELDQWHEYGVYKSARLIDCMGDIDEEKAKQVIKNIRLLDFIGDKDITILLATGGGDVHWGMEIVDAIKECNSKVIIHAVGPCWSMGSIILQAGDYRKISKNATVMIHIGTDKYDENHVLTNKKWMEENERIGKEADDMLYEKMKEKKTKLTRKQFDEMIIFDKIFTAEKSLEYNLVDTITEHKAFNKD